MKKISSLPDDRKYKQLSRKIGSANREMQHNFFNLVGNTPEILILRQLDIA
jgi:hypothetical protein